MALAGTDLPLYAVQRTVSGSGGLRVRRLARARSPDRCELVLESAEDGEEPRRHDQNPGAPGVPCRAPSCEATKDFNPAK